MPLKLQRGSKGYINVQEPIKIARGWAWDRWRRQHWTLTWLGRSLQSGSSNRHTTLSETQCWQQQGQWAAQAVDCWMGTPGVPQTRKVARDCDWEDKIDIDGGKARRARGQGVPEPIKTKLTIPLYIQQRWHVWTTLLIWLWSNWREDEHCNRTRNAMWEVQLQTYCVQGIHKLDELILKEVQHRMDLWQHLCLHGHSEAKLVSAPCC